MTCGIYSIINKNNGKIYIGQSIDICRRLKAHINSLKKNKHYNYHLQNSFNKYGLSNFDFNILEKCSKENLNDNERWWISYFNSTDINKGYNLESGGNSNYICSEETKLKISNANKGEKHWAYGLKRKDNPNYNRKISEKTRKKIIKNHADFSGENNPNFNNKLSEEKKYKMRINVSKKKTSTGILRVTKITDKTCKKGFKWVYSYYDKNNKRKTISRVNINDLKKTIIEKGLLWEITDENKAMKIMEET